MALGFRALCIPQDKGSNLLSRNLYKTRKTVGRVSGQLQPTAGFSNSTAAQSEAGGVTRFEKKEISVAVLLLLSHFSCA